MTYKEVLSKFIEKMDYLNNPDVLGIVFYGSYLTGYNQTNSDLDLHIIMSNNVNKIIRGVTMIDGFKIEYFEKPLDDLYKRADSDFQSQSNALVAMLVHGEVLFDRLGEVKKLQNYIKEKYSKPMPPLSENVAKEMICIIDNRMVQLEKLYCNSDPAFINLYYLNIEKIRKFYSNLCGCPEIPVAKAHKLYTDEKYRESFCKGHVPDKKFIKLYLQAIYCDGSNEVKWKSISKLYNYSKRNIDIDVNNYRIEINHRKI